MSTWWRRKTVAVVCLAVVTATAVEIGAASGAIAATHVVKPHQHFIGLVNGSTGRPNPAVIQMACFGPITPGQTGHPFAGQTVAVHRVPPSPQAGLTGPNATSIGVFFGTLPPSSGGSSSLIDFTKYRTKPIPTSETLPCAGSSNVNFVPIPVEPGSRYFAVPVTYVGQP